MEPAVKGFANNQEEIEYIKELLSSYRSSGFQSLGLIAKTPEQCGLLFDELKGQDVHLLTDESTTFKNGIIITTAHLAKGLEFDEVIIPFASEKNYQTAVDRRMLYIACTRAMHQLTLTYSKSVTPLIK